MTSNSKKTKKVKFPSLMGVSLESARAGDSVGIITSLNCRNPYPPEWTPVLIQRDLDDLVYPEVIARARNGMLASNFVLTRAHVLMYGDESRNEVLLNDEVRFLAHIITTDGKEPKPGPVTIDNISDVAGLYPSEKNDPNAAHIMLLRIKKKWYHAFDFVYNGKLARIKLEESENFFHMAKNSHNEKRWAPMVDALYSATELAIQARLLLMHFGKFSIRQSHPNTKEIFSSYTKAGNLDPKYGKHFSTLKELRSRGRYQRGSHGKKFQVKESEVPNLLSLTNDLINYAHTFLRPRNMSRNPDEAGGYVINIGQG
ncbi:MAG: hypothetical protein ACRD8W_00950 [Nitrososphaeraceae archaeon]